MYKRQAPGNAGIAALAECVPIGAMEFDKLVSFATDNAIDFTIIGMDAVSYTHLDVYKRQRLYQMAQTTTSCL